MGIEVRAATDYDDVRVIVGPKKPTSGVCWCLSYRIPATENVALHGPARGERVAQLLAREGPWGVIGYRGDEIVGWAAVHRRAETSFATHRRIPRLDDVDVWSIWCIRVRPGHRGQGLAHELLAGAVRYAKEQGAPAVEGYPVENGDAKVDLTMAYVGTRRLFEHAGFHKAADTTSVINGFPRIVMRLDLR